MLQNGVYFTPLAFEANFMSKNHTDKYIEKPLALFDQSSNFFLHILSEL